MAYRILYGTDILWEPYSDNTDAITDASMSVNVNAAKYLDFTMPPTHSLYNVIAERDKLIRLYANDKLIYKGYITKITLDMEGYKQVNCSSAMSYLGDTHVRDYSTIEGEQPLKAPTSLDGLFQWYIDQHNKHCMDSNKRFIVGVNQAGLLDENNYVYRSSTQFPTTSSEIEEKILNLGGYIFERYEGDNNILDFYADAHEANTQILDFGVNITDFTHERSGEDQYTAIYATGYTPDPPEDDPEKKMRPISLADIQNGGSPYSPDLFKLGDVLYSISGVQRYGYREYYYSNDDITTTDYLLKAAGIVLTKLLAPTITLDVKAVDMALFMENGYEHLQLGQAVRVRSKPHNIDEYLMISGIDLDLQDPGQTTYTIGATYDTLTGQQSSYLKSLNSGINSSLDSVAALDKATKENAKGINEAKKDASNATSKANEASNKADVATNTANSANTKANEANTKAETATNTANSANTKANEANTKADAATETANIASSKADTATETANSANTKANEAKTKADAATEIANSASSKADTATETANSANTKADEAKTKADAATEIANSASQNAQKAQEGVAAAKDAASKAQAAADKAQADANANTKAVAQAQSAADAAKKAAADAQEKAENVESNLESANSVIEQHSNKLGELSTKVSNAVTNADTALTASTEAKQTATEASITANTAYEDSQTAITNSTKATQTATEAKTTAESAVTTANDSLKQSSSAVQTANRIQNTLTTDYQTKADSDLLYATKSSLTETSESIKMEVSANYATKSTVEALQNVADNAIESWRGSGVPTSENKPASDWATTEEKKRHSGDLYYDKDTGKAYRWGSDDGIVYSWVLNQDTDITKALQDASNAQKSADNAQTTANGAVTAAGNAQKSADVAKSTADSAKTAADNAQKTADTVQTDVDRLKIDIPNTYATKASLETTAESITAQVESVSTTANSAVTAASKAQQTADAINVNLTKNYQTKENADNTYATKATLTATSESLSTSITKAQQTADGAVNAASNAQQTADAININLTKNYQTTKDADYKYATQTSLNATAESITSTVSKTYATKTALANTDTKAVNAATAASNAKTAADNAQSAAEAAQSTADTAKANAATAQSTADTAKTNAATAQSTADQNRASITNLTETVNTKADSSTVTSLSNTVNTIKQTADSNTLTISNLTKTVNTKADNSTVTSLSNTVNTIKQTADSNTLAISNLTETVDTKADSSTVTSLNDTVNTIKQTADSNTSAISNLTKTVNTKADNSTVTTLSNTVNTIKQTVNENSSTITSLTTSVKSKADSAALTKLRNDFDNLEIGGRNLVLNSANIVGGKLNGTTSNEWDCINVGQSYMDAVDGELVTISFDCEYVCATSKFKLLVYNTNMRGPVRFDTVDCPTPANFSQGNTIKFRGNVTTKFRLNGTSATEADNYIEFYSEYKTGRFFGISNIKVERGNKATDWTPAPEDLEQSITTVSNTANQVKQTADSNTSAISNLTKTVNAKADNSTVTTLSNTVNTIKQTADSNTATISNLTKTVGDNKTSIENRASKIEQDLSGFKSTVSSTYSTTTALANAKKEIISMGEQLVINGSGLMGNNTNFSSLIFDASKANGSAGSFTRDFASYSTNYSNQYFPVDPSLRYSFELDAMSMNALSSMYSFLDFSDVDKKQITASDHMYIAGTLTTLARDLKNGDTVVYLNDLTNWKTNNGTRPFARGFIFWNYTNSFGYTYPEETYSKNHYDNLYQDSDVNKTAKTITLTNAWNHGTVPAGTKVSQCENGATFKYQAMGDTKPPTEWKHYAGYYDGTDYSGKNVNNKFPPGTAYAKVGFLWNYNKAEDQVWVTNISVKTDYNNAIQNVQNNLNEYKNEVSNTYSTKTELSQTDGKITALSKNVYTKTEINNKGYTTLTEVQKQGYLTVNSDKITAMVSATTAAKNTADDALELAGTKINESAAIEIAKNQIKNIVISPSGGTTATQSPDGFTWTISSPTVPTKVSQLANDSSFTTMSAVEKKGYQTASQVSTAANNAAKTATNFMKFSASEGLTIGNNTSGSMSGYRTLIKNDGMDVVDESGVSLAHYGSETVIGKDDWQKVRISGEKVVVGNALELNGGVPDTDRERGTIGVYSLDGNAELEFISSYDAGSVININADNVRLNGGRVTPVSIVVNGVNWKYRKIGPVTEAWATVTRTITGGMTDDGVWGYSVKADAVNYPTNLFSSAPKVMISARGPFGYPMLVGNGTAAKTPDMYFYRPTDYDSFTVYFDLYVIGE